MPVKIDPIMLVAESATLNSIIANKIANNMLTNNTGKIEQLHLLISDTAEFLV